MNNNKLDAGRVWSLLASSTTT